MFPTASDKADTCALTSRRLQLQSSRLGDKLGKVGFGPQTKPLGNPSVVFAWADHKQSP